MEPSSGVDLPSGLQLPAGTTRFRISWFFKLPFFISDKVPVCSANPLILERHILVFYSFLSDCLVSVSVVIIS